MWHRQTEIDKNTGVDTRRGLVASPQNVSLKVTVEVKIKMRLAPSANKGRTMAWKPPATTKMVGRTMGVVRRRTVTKICIPSVQARLLLDGTSCITMNANSCMM